MTKMRRHSKISSEIPPELRRQVDTLLVEGNTYEEIKDFLASKGYEIGRSSIGRYGKDFLTYYQRLKVIEDKSKTLVSEAGKDVLTLEEAASKLFVQMILEAQFKGEFDPIKLPRLVSDFAKLQASSVLRERMKMEFKQKVTKAADEVVKVAKAGGLTPEKAEEIRKKILGIV